MRNYRKEADAIAFRAHEEGRELTERERIFCELYAEISRCIDAHRLAANRLTRACEGLENGDWFLSTPDVSEVIRTIHRVNILAEVYRSLWGDEVPPPSLVD